MNSQKHKTKAFTLLHSFFLCFRALFLLLLLLSFIPFVPAENWPQWRGPYGNGIADSTALPVRWSANENIRWKAPLAGLGASSPIVWEDRIFVTSQKGMVPQSSGMQPQLARDDQSLASRENPIGGRSMKSGDSSGEVMLIVEAFRRTDGKGLWKHSMKATGTFPQLHEKHNLATPTPVTDGKFVFALFGTGQVVALDMNGKQVWTRHLGTEYAPFVIPWGHGGSPVLYKGSLLILCDHPGKSYLLALDKNSGKEQWKVDRGKERISHATPLIVSSSDRNELIINSSERVDAYNPDNGELLWYTGSLRQTPVPSPVYHEGIIYLSRGYRNSDFLAMKTGGNGDISGKNILWRAPSGASYVPSILFYQGLLYVTNEIGIVLCADAATGKPVWRERLGGIFFASPVAGDGKIYLVSETGETFVLQSGREAKVLSKNDLGERFLASPAISEGLLFLRSDDMLFCIGK
jgi:outer membrane protein assembly factor BamB